jgi:acyl-CoA thioesterase
MPDVVGPDDAEDFVGRMQQMVDVPRSGWAELADMRRVELPDNGLAMWGRLRDKPTSRPALAFMADFVPVSVARATGQMGAGISLDNSMRFGPLVDTEWVLYDYDPQFATGGYLHGGARVWSQDGTLLGYASQTAAGFVR